MNHTIAREAEELQPWIAGHRRHLHRHPELSYQEEQTAAYLSAEVRALGMQPVRVHPRNHGFFADLVSPRNPDKFVALRADMDALPIQEETGLTFSSGSPGVGHLCGHDSHCAMLLGAAKLLASRQAELPYSVRFFFQHAEEVPPGGALDFISGGALNKVVHCFGLHVRPWLPVGSLSVVPGPQMAGATVAKITVRGRGGHAATPHETTDPVLAASAIVVALQQIAARRTNPFDEAIVSICSFHGGHAHNVIPEEVELVGTTRGFTQEKLQATNRHVREVAQHTAAAYRCEAIVDIDEGYPALVNDVGAARIMTRAACAVLGAKNISHDFKTMGGEDFAYYCREVPSAFGFLGVEHEGAAHFPLHHPKFHPHESAFWRGAAILALAPFSVDGEPSE